jgi:hypothetical protein
LDSSELFFRGWIIAKRVVGAVGKTGPEDEERGNLNLRLSFFISTAISFETASDAAFPTLSLDGCIDRRHGRGRGEGEKEFFQYPLIPAFPHKGGR